MRFDLPPVARAAARQLAGPRPVALPTQRTFRGWVRAALAFQPAYPVPITASSTPAAAAPRTVGRELPLDTPDLRRAIAALPVTRRLALRSDPLVAAAAHSAEILRAINQAANSTASLAGILRDLTFTRDLDLEVARAHDHATALARDLDIARDDARDLDDAHTRDLARDLDDARDDARDLARDLGILSDRARARALGILRDPGRARSHDRARDIAHILDKVGRSARDIADFLGRVAAGVWLDLDLPQGQGRAVAEALLDGALDDFTTTDLRRADLEGIDLNGMYWSVWGTRWPEGFDVEALKSTSREVDPGAGVYRVERTVPSTSNAPTMA